MVRKMVPLSKDVEPLATRSHIKSGACQPRDNLGVSCMIRTDNIQEKLYTGRKMVHLKPPDNIGISCLPTPGSEILENILETEHELLEDSTICSDTDNETLPKNVTTAEIPKHSTFMNNNQRKRLGAATKVRNSSSKTLLNGGRNSVWKQQTSDSSITNAPVTNKPQNKFVHCTKGFVENLTETKKKVNKCGMVEPVDINIGNCRKSKYSPIMLQKPIKPKDNLRLNCQPLQKSAGRFVMPKTRSVLDTKVRIDMVNSKGVHK